MAGLNQSSVTMSTFSLPHLRVTLTLTASHSSPFTLLFLKFIYAFPSLLWIVLHSGPFPTIFCLTLRPHNRSFQDTGCQWSGSVPTQKSDVCGLYTEIGNHQGKHLYLLSSITCGSEPYTASHHRLSSDSHSILSSLALIGIGSSLGKGFLSLQTQ